MKKLQGFTLIEVMIVVAIIGIIAAIAYPSYMDSVRKSNRADAKASLTEAAHRMHRCYTLNQTYENCGALGTTQSAEGFYSIEVKATNGNAGFDVEATPAKAPQTGDSDCTELTLNHLGQKTASPNSNDRCW